MEAPSKERPEIRTRRFRSVFLSDIHLGSKRSRADELLAFLESTEARFLYLVGDVVDHWSCEGTADWPEKHASVLDSISRKVSQGTRVSYLPGNHDGSFRSAWQSLEPGLAVAKQMEHETADGRRFLVLHGDRFDTLIHKHAWMGRLGDGLTFVFEGATARLSFLLPRRQRGKLGLWIKQFSKDLCGYNRRFERSARRWAREHQAAGIICGHSHVPAVKQVDGVLYANDGDWVQSCTALVEHEDGRLEILRAA